MNSAEEESPNWCPICEKETDWLVIPQQLSIVRCKECGYTKPVPKEIKDIDELESKPIGDSEVIVSAGSAFKIAFQTIIIGFVLGIPWLMGIFFSAIGGNFIFLILFSFLYGITVLTVEIYYVLFEVEKIIEEKLEDFKSERM